VSSVTGATPLKTSKKASKMGGLFVVRCRRVSLLRLRNRIVFSQGLGQDDFNNAESGLFIPGNEFYPPYI